MASSGIEVKGLRELQEQLKKLPTKIETNITRTALRRGAKVIEERAKQLAPYKSGALRDSIKVRARTRKKTGWINMQITAGDDKAYYAHIVEFGSGPFYSRPADMQPSRNQRVGGPYEIRPKNAKSLFFAGVFKKVITHPGSRPKAFLRPAFDEKTTEAIEAFAAYMRQRIPKEINKLGLK